MKTELLLERLEGVREVGPNRWTALCPAHDDKSPSLSVSTAGARTLFHCHARCHPDDILDAVGLTWAELYADNKWSGARAAGTANAAWQAAKERARRAIKLGIDLEHEEKIICIVAADIEAGRPVSAQDKARAQLALERIEAHGRAA